MRFSMGEDRRVKGALEDHGSGQNMSMCLRQTHDLENERMKLMMNLIS